MQDLLGASNRSLLEELAWSNALLAFDFDGTLAPIVADPSQAAMRESTRDLLRSLAKLCPVIVISGRSQLDLVKRLRGVELAAMVGNHGMERWQTSGRYLSQVAAWRPSLEAAIATLKGVTLEDKIFSVAVHYRQSREKKLALATILSAARALGDFRVVIGKQVVNILPKDSPHKGIALERWRDRLRCDTALYVGDDETDEDVFALDQPGRVLTVRVGSKRDSGASYCISNQRAIDRLLTTLRDARLHRAEQRRAVR